MTNVYFQKENFILCQLYFKDIAFVKNKCCERKKERREGGKKKRKRGRRRKRGLQLALSFMSEDFGVKVIACILQIASHLSGCQRSFLDESPPSPNPCRRQVRAGARASKDLDGPPRSAGSDSTPTRPFLATRSISCSVHGWETWVCSPWDSMGPPWDLSWDKHRGHVHRRAIWFLWSPVPPTPLLNN